MKSMMTVLMTLGMAALLNAQVVDTLWTRVIGGPGREEGTSVTATSDGGFLIGGTTDSLGAGGTDFYLVRMDSNGDTLWTRAFGHQEDEVLSAVAQRQDGLLLAAGYSYNRGIARWSMDVITVNDAGALVGESVSGSTTADWFAYDLKITADGGYVIAGSVEDSTGSRMLLRKFDSSGILEVEVLHPVGLAAIARAVEQMADGGYLVAGSTRAGDQVPSDFLLVRLAVDGTVLWTRQWGSDADDDIADLVAIPDGGFAFTGPTDVFSSASDFYLARLNADGDTLWTRRYASPGGDEALALTWAAGGFVLAGRTDSLGTNSNVLVMRADSAGNPEWRRTYGGTGYEVARAVVAVENGYMIAGTTTSFGAGDSNLYVIRLGIPETSGTPEPPAVSSRFELAQNYPNPFNPVTRIAFALDRSSLVRLRVFDLMGREVASLLNSELPSGEHAITFDGRNLASGVYVYRLETPAATLSRKMVLMK